MAQIAVILPAYNRAHLLERAIESVLIQSFADFVLYVVDDGSTDSTKNLLQKWEQHPKLKYFFKKHEGVSAARNFGVSMSTEPYLCFLDSDDEWLPQKLELQYGFHKNKGFHISQTRERWIRRGMRVNPPKHSVKTGGDIFLKSLERCMVTPSSVMINRELWEEYGGFDVDFPACEDYELWLRICAKYSVGLLDKELLIRYGGHSDQLSAKYPAMDKFRIQALHKTFLNTKLSDVQKSNLLKVLRKKMEIYRGGCLKRNNVRELNWCDRLLGACRT